ncbi:uncharacterized protein LOC123717808 isoform X1 [Pieris brassicae]|uniref:uncharacterized protein LOC123717808 isoform X1 n=1 Tax=Pieris brassicae TaxID=7116 RepID=UPI001E662509|nr:uncharacterized protein LOC123717808 isoform X1 [Pieris brassicae]
MDFTPELVALQGAILSVDNTHPFTKITARGGNEKKLEAIINALQEFLSAKQFDQNLNEIKKDLLRKFAFYLVLNADLEILQELVELDGVGSVIWTIPTIPKCLLNEILWKLNMRCSVGEIIIYSNPQLSLQLTEILIDHFKYFHPTQCLKNLQVLVAACYKFIYRLIFFDTTSIELTQAVNNFHTCLKYFYEPPNYRKLEMIKKDDKYKYVGNNLYILLDTINDCFSEYVKTQTLKLPTSYSIYELSYKEESIKNLEAYTIDNCSHKDVKESIEYCNEALLDTCKELVKEVSVEIYCAWSEFEEDDKSMQKTVGEICYKVQTFLRNIPTACEHPVISMLEQISCKPLDCVQIINEIDNQTLVHNIINDDEKIKWIRAILYRNDLCKDTVLIEQLTLNISVLNEEECSKLFKMCIAHITDALDVHEYVKLLMIEAFQQCSTEKKFELLDEYFKDSFNDNLETKNFSHMIIEIFNKLTMSSDTDMSEVLCVFLQNPKQVFTKIFHVAAENNQQTQMMVNVMEYLKQYRNNYYANETECCILTVTKELMESDMMKEKFLNYIMFLAKLKSADIIPSSKLFLLIIMPCLYDSLLNKNIIGIHMQCKLLLQGYTLNELVEYRAPLVAMLGQVLETVRWKITMFHTMSPLTLHYGIELLSSILDTYSEQIPEKEQSWLKVKLRNIDPLNLYYFRQLWNPPGDTFLEVITGVHIHKEMDVEQLTARLSKVLCSTTPEEWNQIWKDLKIFTKRHLYNIFHEAVLLIAMAESKHRTDETWSCLMYCFDNFIEMTRCHYLNKEMDENQTKDVVEKIILLENFVNEDIDVFSSKVLPIFTYMAENKDYSSMWNSLNHKIKNKTFSDFINKHIFGFH